MKLFVMQFLHLPVTSSLFGPKLLSAPCSQTPSVYVPPLMSETKFTTIQNQRQKYSLVYSNFTFVDSGKKYGRFWIDLHQALPEFNLLLISS
jgi:hypothetical protein